MGMIEEGHIYSYSQLSSFTECPFGFYLDRIEKSKEPKLSNAFAEKGSLIHDIIDKWAKGEISKSQMVDEYVRRYPFEVVTQFPRIMAKGYAEKAYNLGIEFLEDFDEFEGYEIIATEAEFLIDLELADGTTRPFTGFVDMVLRDKKTDALIVCDHKSKSWSSFKKAEDEMYRQQLLYCAYIYQKFGRYPDYLMFHLFNEHGDKPMRPFTKEAYDETIQWATDCINNIESYEILDWMNSKDSPDFFCQNLCSTRNRCYVSTLKPKTKKKK